VPLHKDYADQACSLSRSLEIIGERWTLLIVRDAFFGVRRFSDFAAHLKISRGVLSTRLRELVDSGVLVRNRGTSGRLEYELTRRGIELWPVIRSLLAWGDTNYAPGGPRRLMHHAACGTLLEREGRCPVCERVPALPEVILSPGPGLEPMTADADPVTRALARPRRLLEPIETAADPAGVQEHPDDTPKSAQTRHHPVG
jgi:DNA-binding HxlR family transcriptional regulator